MFSSEWDNCYRSNGHMSKWPWSDLVSFCMRYVNFQEGRLKVLELGCGAGANIPFFVSMGVEYFAIEGSATIVSKLHEQFPNLKENIVVGDFCQKLPSGEFDLIVDRAAVTCNNSDSISNCLHQCYRQLKKNGNYIGIDWYSSKSSYYNEGVQAEDVWTKKNIGKGSFANTGRVHFSDKFHLHDLFSDFNIFVLEHKTVVSQISLDNEQLCSWNFVARK